MKKRLTVKSLHSRVERWKAKAERFERKCKILSEYIHELEKLSVVSADRAQILRASKAKRKINLFV